MERLVRLLSVRKSEGPAGSRTSRHRSVERSLVAARARSVKHLRRPVLHEVHLAAIRPRRAGSDAIAERPKGRPKSGIRCVRQLEARLNPAKLKSFYARRQHAR